MTFDGKAFGAEIVSAVKDHMADAIGPITARLDAMEAQLDALPSPKDGKDADEDAIIARVTEKMASEIAEIRAAASLPDIEGLVKEAVAAIPAPQDGKSVTPDDVRPLIEEGVAAAVAALPKPKDGRGIRELLINRDGELVATMDDGVVEKIGPVVGKDADVAALERFIEGKIAALPKPKDGIDGIGFDDMVCEVREDGVYLVWEKDDIAKEARLPVPMDRGVYNADQTYHPGDIVSWGGSAWIAAETTDAKPDASKDGKPWRLMVKRGRDGKDVK